MQSKGAKVEVGKPAGKHGSGPGEDEGGLHFMGKWNGGTWMQLCNNLGIELMGRGDEFDIHQDGEKDDAHVSGSLGWFTNIWKGSR